MHAVRHEEITFNLNIVDNQTSDFLTEILKLYALYFISFFSFFFANDA